MKRSEVDLGGQTAIVTGSNTGIGLEASRQLLDLGVSKLILAVRSISKGEAARKDLLAGRSGEKQIVEVWKLDLADYDSILEFVERTKTLEKLHLVIHNAGISKFNFALNPKTGHEQVFQTNYLSLALIVIKMLPVLQQKNTPERPGRMVLVNSETSAWAKFEEKNASPMFPAFDKEDKVDPSDRYWTSKLLGQLFLTELAKRVPPTVVLVNASNPGLCYGSSLMSDLGGVPGLIVGFMVRLLGRSTSLGAQALTDASVRHGLESHGHYIEDGKLQP